MEEKKPDRLNIFGRSMSRLEVAINGIIFLFTQVTYEAFSMRSQLPDNWTDKDLENITPEFWIPTLLLIGSILLIDKAIFGGGEERIDELLKKHSPLKLITIKYFLMFVIVFVSLFLPFVILKIFFQ